MPIAVHFWKTPFGELLLGSHEDALCLCDWRYRRMRAVLDQRLAGFFKTGYIETSSPVIAQAIGELGEYFAGQRREFELPLSFAGTAFQIEVWHALQQVPYGETATYSELAHSIGKPSAIRAVASANGANALSIFIPCHRIIGSDGKLVGYAGGLATKRKLLDLEQPTLFEA